MPTANSSSDNLLDKLQFNNGGGDCFFHFIIIFYNKGVAFILHTHKIKQVLITKRVPAPTPKNILNIAIQQNRKIKTSLISKFQ